ncbi:DUF433 domain-containing protein [Prosthecomicrobium hirschii]|uniref:DUF433 domain-containing protein n=1 Tax=Prosthecodimorpha hirschii TaxID=665126 RepID=UPI00221F999E|nr:DUF433 domain-containing protein [Prosthecomicrobium hirschii]MCW1844084.1 DUF433 domain-containing protein [Prosthecomicrobium hirschii]
MTSDVKTRIVSDPGILSGMPVVEGTRVPAENVLIEVRRRLPRAEIFNTYPSLPLDGIEACLAWERAGKPL